MKRTSFLLVIIAAVLAVISQFFPGASSARTPQSYPLVCRGGPSLVIGMAPGVRNIGFTFTRGTKPAREGLAPGECSWVDRGMQAAEPDRLSQHVEDDSASLKVGGKLAPENRWFEELHSSDKYWTFQVSNNGRGQLIATGARPNAEMSVSPRARVPAEILATPTPTPGMPTPKRSDLPRVGTPGNETPRVIVLNDPPRPMTRAELLKGLPAGLAMDVPPVPRALSMEEKTGLLKSAGVVAADKSPEQYVMLTPQQPHVAGRGDLRFVRALSVDSGRIDGDPGLVFFLGNYKGETDFSGLSVYLKFESKGIYFLTFTVRSDAPVDAEFNLSFGDAYHGTTQTFLAAKDPPSDLPPIPMSPAPP